MIKREKIKREIETKLSTLHEKSSVQKIIEIDREIDHLFGIDFRLIESRVIPESDKASYTSIKIEDSALYNSYFDFYRLKQKLPLREGDHIVDLGSGYGRMKLLYNLLFPEIKVTAIEKIEKRMKPGFEALKSLNLPTDDFHCDDLQTCPLPKADYYFYYLPKGELLDIIMKRLEDIACYNPLTLITIESHGDLLEAFRCEYDWIKGDARKIPTKIPRHDPHFYFFKSYPPKTCQGILRERKDELNQAFSILKDGEDLIFQKLKAPFLFYLLKELGNNQSYEFLIDDQDIGQFDPYRWLGSTYGLQVGLGKTIELLYPKRVVKLQDILFITQAEKKFQYFIQKRFEQKPIIPFGVVKKIIVAPEEIIEFSEGRVPFDQVSFFSNK